MNLRSLLLPVVGLTVGLFVIGATITTGALPPVEADAPARLASSPRHGEWVAVPTGNGQTMEAWLVYPERADPAPVVILVHEIFGLTDWARAVADQYAAEGFLVIAPDFLSRKAPDGQGGSKALGPEAARAEIAKLTPAEIQARLDASARFATALPAARKNYGVVGYCWGGGVAFSWATVQPTLGAAVVYYGTSPATEALSRVQAPVLGLYGGTDARVNATVGPARDEMTKLGKRYEVEIYEGAGHAFLRQQAGQNGANMTATQKAWPRSVAFLKEALEGKAVSLGIDDCVEDCAPVPALALESSQATLAHLGH